MKTIRTTLIVEPDGRTVIQLPPDVTPGSHEAVLVIDEPRPEKRPLMDHFPRYDVTPGPGFPARLSREEIYDDEWRGA